MDTTYRFKIVRKSSYVDIFLKYLVIIDGATFYIRDGESINVPRIDSSAEPVKATIKTLYFKKSIMIYGNTKLLRVTNALSNKPFFVMNILLISCIVIFYLSTNQIISTFCIGYSFFYLSVLLYYATFGYNNYLEVEVE